VALTDHQLAALRRLRTASGVWRHWVQTNGLGINSWTWTRLLALGLVERRPHSGMLSAHEYRLTAAGHDAVQEETENDMLIRWVENYRRAKQADAVEEVIRANLA